MSDNNGDIEIKAEDEAMLEVLDDADGLGMERRIADASPEARAYLETLGLLPYGLDEETVRPEVKSELLARASSGSSSAPSAEPARGRIERYWQLAAMLAIAFGFLALQQFQAAKTRELTGELQALLESQRAERSELQEIRRLLAAKSSQIEMLTTRGTEYCLLKPRAGHPEYRLATATMAISANRDRWYLAAEGLLECQSEGCYDLWFLTEGGPMHGASFGSEGAGSRIELTGEHEGIPEALQGIVITHGGAADPDQQILFADQAMTIL